MIRKLKILGQDITVRYIKNWDGHQGSSPTMAGRFYPSTMTIYIVSTMPKEAQRRMLLHELCHAVMFINGVSQTISLDHEESIAQTFSFALKDFSRQGLI